MAWQDIVISVCQLLAVFSLLPSILSDDKPALKTSVMNVVLVSLICFSLFTLGLYFSAATAFAIVISWSVLAYQKYATKKK